MREACLRFHITSLCKNISHRVADVLTVRSLKFKFFVKSTDSNTLKRNRDGSVSINEY